jgi:hypothetical protein
MDRLPLNDDTAHVSIQGRQYELFNVDLGQGIVRDHLALGGIIFAVWIGFAWLIGVPILSTYGFLAYIGPPWIVTMLALRLDHGGRPSYAGWWCRIRFLGRRRWPVVPPLGHAPIHPALAHLARPKRRRGRDQSFTAKGQFIVLSDLPSTKGTST